MLLAINHFCWVLSVITLTGQPVWKNSTELCLHLYSLPKWFLGKMDSGLVNKIIFTWLSFCCRGEIFVLEFCVQAHEKAMLILKSFNQNKILTPFICSRIKLLLYVLFVIVNMDSLFKNSSLASLSSFSTKKPIVFSSSNFFNWKKRNRMKLIELRRDANKRFIDEKSIKINTNGIQKRIQIFWAHKKNV